MVWSANGKYPRRLGSLSLNPGCLLKPLDISHSLVHCQSTQSMWLDYGRPFIFANIFGLHGTWRFVHTICGMHYPGAYSAETLSFASDDARACRWIARLLTCVGIICASYFIILSYHMYIGVIYCWNSLVYLYMYDFVLMYAFKNTCMRIYFFLHADMSFD